MNNQITDFSFDPGTPEAPIANRVQPNKRPRSSMSPTIVLDKYGKPYLATGSPGGSRIIGYVLGMDIEDASNGGGMTRRITQIKASTRSWGPLGDFLSVLKFRIQDISRASENVKALKGGIVIEAGLGEDFKWGELGVTTWKIVPDVGGMFHGEGP